MANSIIDSHLKTNLLDMDSKSLLEEIRSLLEKNKGIISSLDKERKADEIELDRINKLLIEELKKAPANLNKRKKLKDEYFKVSRKLDDNKLKIINTEIAERNQKIYDLKQQYHNQISYEKGFKDGLIDEEIKELKNKSDQLFSKREKKNKIPTNDALWAIADDMRGKKDDGEFSTYREAYQWACDTYDKKNVELTVLKLERAYHKAVSERIVGDIKISKQSIAIMITNDMRSQLSMLGYDREEMKHLTLEQCREIINKGVPKKPSRERGRNQ